MQNPKPPNRKFGHDLAAFRAPHAENNGVSIQRPCSMQFFWLKFHSSLFVSSIDPSLKTKTLQHLKALVQHFSTAHPPKKMMSNQRPVTSSLASSGPTFETTSTQCCRKGGIEVSEKKSLTSFNLWICQCQDNFLGEHDFFCFLPMWGMLILLEFFVGEHFGLQDFARKAMNACLTIHNQFYGKKNRKVVCISVITQNQTKCLCFVPFGSFSGF